MRQASARRSLSKKAAPANGLHEPAWEIARLFPLQGHWSEGDYLALDTNRLVELTNGRIEVLPMPTTSHQFVVLFLYRFLFAFVEKNKLGIVLLAPLPVRLWPKNIREPDVVFMAVENADRIEEEFWQRADLMMEVVSKGGRKRDLVEKRRDYARAGIPEYWIVDPQLEQITVLRLRGKQYVVHGEFKKGERATSVLLPGFAVDVTAVLEAGATAERAKRGRRRSSGR